MHRPRIRKNICVKVQFLKASITGFDKACIMSLEKKTKGGKRESKTLRSSRIQKHERYNVYKFHKPTRQKEVCSLKEPRLRTGE
jgi:hypothetical protein